MRLQELLLKKLIADGRIHPYPYWKEMVDKARREVEYRIKQEGERAIIETNVHGLNQELSSFLDVCVSVQAIVRTFLTTLLRLLSFRAFSLPNSVVDANLARRAGLHPSILAKALTAENGRVLTFKSVWTFVKVQRKSECHPRYRGSPQ